MTGAPHESSSRLFHYITVNDVDDNDVDNDVAVDDVVVVVITGNYITLCFTGNALRSHGEDGVIQEADVGS